MATTHVFVGLLAGALVAGNGDAGTAAVLAGGVGGLLPDLDLYAGHRRTLHFPVAGLGVAAVLVAGTTLAPALSVPAALVAGAALHAAMDALGGGLELRPWERTSERAVYSHVHGRWLRPRRWVRYDGAPEDAALAALAAAPTLLGVVGGLEPIRLGLAALLALSLGYAALRRPLADLWSALARRLPGPVAARLPERFDAGPRA
ncbi:MAG: metal-dependent hydrolase [Halobacteriaceae archaeon]